MKDTDRDPGHEDAIEQGRDRPAWVSESRPGPAEPGRLRARHLMPARVPVSGRREDDGLWTHVTEAGGLLALATWVAAIALPHHVPLWMITMAGATVTAVAWYVSLDQARSMAMACYLGAWGIVLTGWITVARLRSPWQGTTIFGLVLPALVLIPAGVNVIRRHRDRLTRVTELGRDTANIRECTYWDGLLQRFGVTGITVRDVMRVEGGKQVHCRLGKFTADGRKPATIEGVRELAGLITQQLRLARGAVYIEEEPAGGSSADFIIHVRTVTGPRLARFLPADNRILDVNKPFGLGVLDTGREFRLLLREVVVFICGLRGSGKSTLLQVFIAQLSRMPNALIFMIDLKGGQEARPWLMPWLEGKTGRPAIDWLATTREEASIMLDALWRAGQARAESGRYGRKLRPRPDAPAIVVICDETAVMTGHMVREDNISNTKLATKLLQVAETFRSVAIDPVVAAVRAVVDVTGNSGFKAMSEVRIGMRVATAEEGRSIFPDNLAAAKQLAQLKDRGTGIPKVGPDLSPPVHFYNITAGEPDDDGNPTEDRITPIVLATAAHRPMPEQLIRDAMGEPYAKRWDGEHIKALTSTWLEETGRVQPAEGLPARQPGGVPPDDFEAMIQADPLLREFESGGNDDRDDGYGERLNPARKRMRQLLIGRGREGWKADDLWHAIQSEGGACARQTVHAWLKQDEGLGYVYRTGKPRSRWVWRLPEGAEFEIPGMD